MSNLLSYKTLDPDELYYNFPQGSITFFYVPTTQNLYVAPYPKNHKEMLIEDDDLFDDVYGDLEWGPKERKEWASRGRVLALTNAMLGRIAAVGEDFVVSFWKNPSRKNLDSFFKKVFKKFPSLEKRKDFIIVIAPESEPFNLSGKPLDSKDTVAVADTPAIAKEKKFKIGNNSYSLQDLQNLRAALHTKSQTFGDPMAVLCHPDMDKYPALAGYKPVDCGGDHGELRSTHPEKWRQSARPTDSYFYKYGESFKEFFDKNS